MRTKRAFFLVGAAVVAGSLFIIASHLSKSSPAEGSSIGIVYSENNGSLPPDYARSRTIDLEKSGSGKIEALYELKDGHDLTLVRENLSLLPQEFDAILAAAREVSFSQPALQPTDMCVGGGGSRLELRDGTETLTTYSVDCGHDTANKSLQDFYSKFLGPLVAGLPAK